MGTSYKNEQVDQLIRDAQVELDVERASNSTTRSRSWCLDDAHFLYLYYPAGRTARKLVQNLRRSCHRQLPVVRDVAGRPVEEDASR